MAPPTKTVRMERELELGAAAVAEWRRLQYLADVARVKVDIRVRRSQKFGASLRTIEAGMDIPRATADRICKGPEPAMPERNIA